MGCSPSSLNKGRTATSVVGLFPQSFTTPDPPGAATASPPIEVHGPEPDSNLLIALQTMQGDPETGSVGSPNPDPVSTSTPGTADGEVMHATMTDVQKAIEQLGRHDADGSRSFSFASSRGDADGDGDWTDRESATDTEGEIDGWHLNARQRLAEKSRMVNEESAGPSTPMRMSAPPIEVELSDESEAEAEDEELSPQLYVESPYPRSHPHIPEEEEDDAQSSKKLKSSNLPVDLEPGTPVMASDVYIVPSPAVVVDDLPTATIPGKSFVKEQDHQPTGASPEPDPTTMPEPELEVRPDPRSVQVPPAQIPLPTSPSRMNGLSPSPPPTTPPPIASPIPVSPFALTNGSSERARTPIFHPPGTPSSSTITSIGIQQALGTPTKPRSTFRSPAASFEKPVLSSPSPSKPPTGWAVEEVVDWLKDKGIDQGTCDKFIGMCTLSRVRVHRANVLPCRTRHYWRRPLGLGHRLTQDRDRHHRFRETEADC